jgi:uncharacterized membrane protein
MVGIENLKNAILVGIKLGMGVKESLEDGKVTFGEVLGLLPKLAGLPKVIMNASSLKDEFKDLTPQEVTEIKEFVTDKLELDDKVEDWIEYSLDIVSLLLSAPK